MEPWVWALAISVAGALIWLDHTVLMNSTVYNSGQRGVISAARPKHSCLSRRSAMSENKPTLTQARLKELFHYDPETGVFTRKVRTAQRSKVGEIAGFHNAQGYIGMKVDGQRYVAHRLAWLYVHGYFPPNDLDHKDTVRDHNWISNLRLATRSENRQNLRTARSDSKSKLIGVITMTNSWQARIQANGKSVHLGTFSTPELAHSAYLAAKVKLHPFQTLVERSD